MKIFVVIGIIVVILGCYAISSNVSSGGWDD